MKRKKALCRRCASAGGGVALPVRFFIEKFNRLLGLSRQLLHYKLHKYKMKREGFKD